MDAELLKQFENEEVRIVYKDGFKINGVITRINNDSFLFKTNQGISVVDSSEVRTVVKLNGGQP